jgi:predicted Zn-dependent protease
MPQSSLSVIWFDGEQAEAQAASLQWDQAELQLQHAHGEQRYARAALVWPEPTQAPVRQLLLPDGSVVECHDSATWDAWCASHAIRPAPAVRWAQARLGPLLATVLTLALGLAAWRWAVPVVADHAALWVSPEAERKLGDSLWRQIDGEWVFLSQLSKAEIDAAWAAMAPVMALADPDIRVSIRRGDEKMGPNAFALPGGQIVITDALVRLLLLPDGTVHPALGGVLAHEIGHVQHRHGLRSVFRATATTALTGLWLGDYSALLAAGPAVFAQASYRRDAEREADATARELMQRAQIDPRSMVFFFAHITAKYREGDGDTTYLGLSSHPADNERIRFFETGSPEAPAQP